MSKSVHDLLIEARLRRLEHQSPGAAEIYRIARFSALEEAALECEQSAKHMIAMPSFAYSEYLHGAAAEAQSMAHVIRALKNRVTDD